MEREGEGGRRKKERMRYDKRKLMKSGKGTTAQVKMMENKEKNGRESVKSGGGVREIREMKNSTDD